MPRARSTGPSPARNASRLAGDYCVLETLKNIVALRGSTLGIKVFLRGVASIDGGKALADYMAQTGIGEYTAE